MVRISPWTVEATPNKRIAAALIAEGSLTRTLRMDMHVHSRASSKPVIAALAPLGCPESYSPPERVYEQARARGMDFVTLTDHDTIAGALELSERGYPNVILGEEVTVEFPEDRCKLHVLVWGLSPHQHETIADLGLREDVYAFAAWLHEQNLPHALAHPLYIQNNRLSIDHLERAALLFKGFETLNGAHSSAHTDALNEWLASLTPARVRALAQKHSIHPHWSRMWVKARTGGSDDHALLNIGRTWTSVEVENDIDDADLSTALLERVMAGRAAVGGQSGHSALLAHQLISVGLNYYESRIHDDLPPAARSIGRHIAAFAGVRPEAPSAVSLMHHWLRSRLNPNARSNAHPMLSALQSIIGPLLETCPELSRALSDPDGPAGPPLAAHEPMAEFTDELVERLIRSITPSTLAALRTFDKPAIVDALVSYATILAIAAPHIFSLFHQNKERRFLHQVRRAARSEPMTSPDADNLRIMLFTDTLGDINGVCRFIQNMGAEAHAAGRTLDIIASTRFPTPEQPYIHNFDPIFAATMPGYANLEVTLPPVLRILRLADKIQPDVIHISTPGPVGLLELLAARMLRIPVIGVYHTDFPAYIDHLFDDPSYTGIATWYMKWFYQRFARVFSRSDDYISSLVSLGLDADRMLRLTPGVALQTFRADLRNTSIWPALGAKPETIKVLYCGRVSVEKNLPLLTAIWPEVRGRCMQAGVEPELIIVGDGPYRHEMQQQLASHRIICLGFRHGTELSTIYASADLFVFPSTTDTLGQVVLESQSSGLPVLVSDRGGPKEVVDHNITGLILPGEDRAAWTDVLTTLILDNEQRSRLGRSAQTRAQRYTLSASFEHFWQTHAAVHHEAAIPRSDQSTEIHSRAIHAVG